VSPVKYELRFYIPEDGIRLSYRSGSHKYYNVTAASILLGSANVVISVSS
jgi:hypothetical protein